MFSFTTKPTTHDRLWLPFRLPSLQHVLANQDGLRLPFGLCLLYSASVKPDLRYRRGCISLTVGVLLIPLPYLYTLFIATSVTVIRLVIAVGAVTTVDATTVTLTSCSFHLH